MLESFSWKGLCVHLWTHTVMQHLNGCEPTYLFGRFMVRAVSSYINQFYENCPDALIQGLVFGQTAQRVSINSSDSCCTWVTGGGLNVPALPSQSQQAPHGSKSPSDAKTLACSWHIKPQSAAHAVKIAAAAAIQTYSTATVSESLFHLLSLSSFFLFFKADKYVMFS